MSEWTPEDRELLDRYGPRFLRFVLSIEEALDPSTVDLDPTRAQILADLRETATVTQMPERLADGSELQRSLAAWQMVEGSQRANRWREAAGGKTPSIPETEDPLEAALLRIAADVWPSYLISLEQVGLEGPQPDGIVPILDDSANLSGAKALLQDDDLAKLFPGAPSGGEIDDLNRTGLLDIGAQWTANTGTGGGMQLVMLLPNIIGKARLWSLAAGDGRWDGLCRELSKVLTALRALARGEVAEVPYCIALAGLRVPADIEVRLDRGVLRAPRPDDWLFVRSSQVEMTAIYMTTFPLRVYVGEREGEVRDGFSEAALDDIGETNRKVRENLDTIRLAALLASKPGERWSLVQVASSALNPAGFAATTYWRSFLPPVQPADLDRGGALRIEEWFARLETGRSGNLDIARGRVLAASSDRLDPVDGLVDAVVAWENCFGTDTETTFRVTGAVAALLESTTEARLSRAAALKKIYSKRSQIVHGAAHLGAEEAGRLRDEAIDIALDCLRRLYRDRTDLLSLESAVRSTTLMLETPPFADAVDAASASGG